MEPFFVFSCSILRNRLSIQRMATFLAKFRRGFHSLMLLYLMLQYHGSYSLKHWLQLSDWLPTLEATLALDEEWVRRVGDDRVGGPAVTRQLRITRILMRDLLIGVCLVPLQRGLI